MKCSICCLVVASVSLGCDLGMAPGEESVEPGDPVEPGDGDPGTPDPDSNNDPPGEMDPSDECTTLTIGGCMVDGDPCPDVVPDSDLRELNPDTVVSPMLGLQGSPMFLIVMEVPDIDRGDGGHPETFPMVDLLLETEGGELVATYNRWSVWQEKDGLWQARPLRVIPDGDVDAMEGESLVATAVVVDRQGTEHCGSTTFTAGPVVIPE